MPCETITFMQTYFPRSFSFDTMTYLLPPDNRLGIPRILQTDLICKDTQRGVVEPSKNSPRLQANPGATIALRYQENGHITGTSAITKLSTGSVSVYGTFNSLASDTLLSIHHVWNKNNTGGDLRGRLRYSTALASMMDHATR